MTHVPFGQRHLARWLSAAPKLSRRLAAIESAVVRDELDGIRSATPVWICGMARAGSTILLEALNDAAPFTAHQYADYPWLWTPYWRNWLRARLPAPAPAPRERAHADRLQVTPSSPEAFEELFWMHYFADRHDPQVSQLLNETTSNPDFERFFDEHQRKLLLVRGASRYLAKANYQLARLAYLHRLYPQARFVIPVREPLAQVQSLIQQDQRFRQMHREDPAVGAHMARIGHFEFGPQKRAFHLGDAATTQAIADDFAADRVASGYARQWAAQYGHVVQSRRRGSSLDQACIWVSYERLCANPTQQLSRIAEHVGLADDDSSAWLSRWATRISAPAPTTLPATLKESVEPITASTWNAIQPLLD